MGAKKALTGIIMTVWTFVTMVVIPLSTIGALERGVVIKGKEVIIRLYNLNVGLVFVLGIIAMMLTAFSYSVSEKNSAFLIMMKYIVVAYYEWVWAVGVRRMEVIVEGNTLHVGADLGVWILIVIISSLLSGLLKALHRYMRGKREEEEKKKGKKKQ